MENIYWQTLVDRIYCIHYLPQNRKLQRLTEELKRVDIIGHSNFQWRYTSPTRYDRVVFESAPGIHACDVGVVNLGMEVRRMLVEAVHDGCKRVMILENDVAFLKDKDEIAKTMASIPDGYGIVQLDKFIIPGGDAWYREFVFTNSINECFFDPHGFTFYSGSCFVLCGDAIQMMADELEECLDAPDAIFTRMETKGVRRAIAKKNMAIQLVYAGSISATRYGVNSHHDGYVRQGLEYNDYSVPCGYGRGKAL